MSVRLTITRRDQPDTAQEPRTEKFDSDTILLGRDPGCNVVLLSSTVSRSHARITRDGGVCYIEDSGSSFGTQVNNEPLPQGEKRRLYNGDIIAIAQFDLLFEVIAQMHVGARPWQSETAQSMPSLSIIVSEKPYLRIMNGPNEGTRIELEEGHEYIVGRTQEAHILLNTDLVSRKHAKLRRDLGGTHIEDLGSRNGIRLNRKAIVSATLSDGDELEIGGIKLLYIDLSDMKDSPLSFDKPETKTPASQSTKTSNPQNDPLPQQEVHEPEKPPENAPQEDAPPEENFDNLGLSPETSEKPPRPPLLQGNQAVVLFGIIGSTALVALIFLILVLVGA
jgi:pSer/pThr/pTyr-binding forkhead associated (FHA) protein